MMHRKPQRRRDRQGETPPHEAQVREAESGTPDHAEHTVVYRGWFELSPLTNLYGGAFGRSAAADRARVYAGIPAGTDILITHGPPFGVLDRPVGTERSDGCRELRAAVRRVRPRLHVFGHIHGRYGMHSEDGTVFVNAALVGESMEIEQGPMVVELDAGVR